MLLRNGSIFIVGLLVGIAGCLAVNRLLNLDLTPPEPQETTPINVRLISLRPEDEWLKGVQFSLVPLDHVKSDHKYAVLILTPPTTGLHLVGGGRTSHLDLTASTTYWTTVEIPGVTYSFPEGIQPIQVDENDFGPNGDKIGVKFIDEGQRPTQGYRLDQPLLIGSSPIR